MTSSDWVMLLVVLLAPLLAVQAQKYLESIREKRERKVRIFKQLMATRAATVSPEHVQALNMIDLEFHEEKYKKVTGAWKIYLDHLGNYPKDDEKHQPVWADKRVDLLAKLLLEMGKALGYEFDEVHIKKGIYAPEGHAQIENENFLIRRGIIRLLYGDTNLQMDVKSFPYSEEATKEQAALRKGIQNLVDGKRSLSVRVDKEEGDGLI